MYTLDTRGIGKITWEKLVDASRRGVKVVCAVDFLRKDIKKKAVMALREKGGIFIEYNNPLLFIPYFWEGLRHKVLSRHHEKIILVDDKLFIGSGNMKGEYGGPRFGTSIFHDVYTIIKKAPAGKTLEFMKRTVDPKDQDSLSSVVDKVPLFNDTLTRYRDENDRFDLLFDAPKEYSEVKTRVVEMLASAKKEILIVQPYFQLVPRITREILSARRRGVKVTIVTAHDRDLRVYKHLRNYLLMGPLIDAGCAVYEDMNKYLHMKIYMVDNKKLSLGNFVAGYF